MTDALAACAGLPVVTFAPDEALLTEGGAGGRLYVLVEGEVRVTRGGTEVARIHTPGALFGEMSVLLDIPHSASVVAVTPVRARVSEDAMGFIEATPAIAIHTARTLAQRLYSTTGYLADIKRQFADKSDHLGMVDTILEELLQQQRSGRVMRADPADDPRL